MDSPSLDSAGSPVSSTDASERPSGKTSKHLLAVDTAMQVDENTPLAPSTSEAHKKRKNEEHSDDTGKIPTKAKKSTSPKVLQSSRHESEESDEDAVEVTSQQVKRPKLAAEKNEKSSTPKRSSASASTSKQSAVPSSNATKDTTESAIVQFKNGKLLLKQKKIDFSQQNAALQKRIDWNGFIEDVEESLEEIPEQFHPLVALMIHESERTSSDLVKTVKNALNPPLTGDDDSQGDENVDKLPLAVVTRTINILAERVNHGFRDTPASEKGDIINIDDSDESGAESSTSKVAKRKETEGDLPRGYDTVPNGLRLFRWEVKKELRSDLFACLSKEMQEKIESRAEERLQAREEAKKLLAAMSKSERKEILLQGIKTGNDGASTASKAVTDDKGKGKAKAEKASASAKVKSNDDGASSSTEKEKGKKGRKPKELTEEEKLKKEAEQAEKERKKAEKEAAKAEKEAAKAVKEAAKAEKDAIKAEKEAAKAEKEALKAKEEQAKKQQKNAFGAWLAKAGTSPVEILNNPTASSSHSRHASSTSSERGSLPPVSAPEAKKASKDYYSTFKPFFVRAGVEVAPVNRFALKKRAVKEEETEEMEVDGGRQLSKEESFADFMSRAAVERIPSTSKLTVEPLSTVMMAMQECEIRGDMDAYHRLRSQLRNTERYPMKLLKFHTDVRPGYFGTWTKSSSSISGRNPYGRDLNLLDYDYDSEAEWDEDPEDAEDINNESGDEEMSESDDDLDGWLAGDDEVEFEAGYEGEMSLADMMDENNDPFAQSAMDLDGGKKKIKKTSKPLVKKKKLTGPLIPVIKGPYWEDEENDEEDATGLSKFMSSFKISWLGKNEAGTLDPFAYVEKKSRPTYTSNNKPSVPTSSDNPTKAEKPVASGAMQVKKAELPVELLDPLKASVLASKTTTRPLLIEEVFTALQKLPYKINKGMVDRAIGAVFDKKKKADVGMAPDGSEGCHWEIKKV